MTKYNVILIKFTKTLREAFMKKNNYLKTLMTIIVTGIVTFSVTFLWMYGKNKETNETTESKIGNALTSDYLTTKLQIIKNKIEDKYFGEIDEDKLKEYAIKGYVAGLGDEYSQYFSKDEMKEYTDDTLGNYVGIGVYMTKDKERNEIVVYGVMENSPAEKAGVKEGDIIAEVNGEKVTVEDFEDLPNKIKGVAGTKVKMTFIRNEEKIPLEITRANVEIKNVTGKILENNIGYIYISSFDGDVSKQFKEKYDELLNQGMKSLVLDLRNNGGGIAEEAVEIGDYFTDKGKTLLIETDKEGKENKTLAKKDREINIKTVLLINEYSASASEILAGILKEDVNEATLVGKTTYGKGVIQTLYQLSDGSGVKITTSKYYTPNKNNIDKEGIKPDVETDKYDFSGKLDEKEDIQLKKAIEILK